MTHREDPNRGVFRADCEFCGETRKCRLVAHRGRYKWACTKCRTEGLVLSMGSL
jgi:hypothetical protein